MKDFKIGQEVYVLRRENQNIMKGNIIKKFENSNRWKIRFNLSRLFKLSGLEDKEKIIERFRFDKEVYFTLEEAYNVGMKQFDDSMNTIESNRRMFIEESNKLK